MTRPKITALLVFFSLVTISVLFINLRYEYCKQRHESEMNFLLNAAHKNLEQTLKASYNSNLAIAMTINDNGVPENFAKVSREIIQLNPIIDVIELVPDGIVKYVYPLESNKSVIDYNILTNASTADEAKLAITKKVIYFAGPFELKQGGLGIAGRYPIYRNDKFWGFSAIIIRFDKLMQTSGMYALKDPNYYFQFSKVNLKTKKETFFLSQSADFKNKSFQKIFLSDGNWNLYLIDKVNNPYYISDLIPYLILCFLICLFLPYFIYYILRKPQELALINSIQARKIVQADAKFQVIFNKTSIAIVQIDTQSFEILLVNARFRSLISANPRRTLDQSFLELVHPEDQIIFTDFLTQSKSLFVQNTFVTIRLKNSVEGYIWSQIVPSPMVDENQSITTTILAIENISERKIADEKLIQSELQFKSLFQESPIPLWEEDGSEVKRYFLELNLLGKEREFVKSFLENNPVILFKIISKIRVVSVNQECLNLYEAKDKYELIDIFTETMKLSPTAAMIEMLSDMSQGSKKGQTQGIVIFPDGKQCVYSMTWNVVAGYEESFGRFIISTVDITAQTKAQKLIIASEQKLQSIIDSIDGIVWEFDTSRSKYQFISGQCEKIVGYTSEEWLANINFWEKNVHPDDQVWVAAYCTEKIKIGASFTVEYRFIAKNGGIIWLRDIVNIHRQDNGSVLLRGIMIDISLIKQSTKDLNKSLAMVTEQNKRLINFSYIVSHNLRSHTSNIHSLSILIKETEDVEEQKKLIELIEIVSTDLNDTISNLNEVINVRKDVNLNVQNLKLVGFIVKTLEVLSEEIKQKNITITGKIPPNTTISYNKAYLQSILINIISNAVRYAKATDDNRFIKFNFYNQDEFSVLEIEDNGIGINLTRHKDKIFGLYKTFSTNKDAKGIGLFITKNQIEAMSGKIEIESELNKGTTIRIYFRN